MVFSGSGGAVVVDLGLGEISDAGVAGGVVAFQGIELLEVEAAGGALTVLGSGEADRLEVHPEGPASGWLQRAAVAPRVSYRNVAGNVLTVDGAGGVDVVAVFGSQGRIASWSAMWPSVCWGRRWRWWSRRWRWKGWLGRMSLR